MAILSPAYTIVLPFLFFFTLPIALLATFTTFLAFSLLLFRVTIIYIELTLTIIPHYLLGTLSPKSSLPQKPILTPPPSARRKKRRSSTSSSLSAAGSITPIGSDHTISLGLSQSVGFGRDFEGVGGWRLDNPSDDDGLWTNINSRLELPADHGRRHHRSLTSGSMPLPGNRSGSPETVMNTSRARTPPNGSAGLGGEYFPQGVGKGLKRNNSGVTGVSGFSGSSGSSKGSTGLTMKQR